MRETDFSLLHTVQSGSGPHPTSYPMGTVAGREDDRSLPSGAEVKHSGAITLLPYMSSRHNAN
jgi:hypothetical protein